MLLSETELQAGIGWPQTAAFCRPRREERVRKRPRGEPNQNMTSKLRSAAPLEPERQSPTPAPVEVEKPPGELCGAVTWRSSDCVQQPAYAPACMCRLTTSHNSSQCQPDEHRNSSR